jgi:hypothetical protein
MDDQATPSFPSAREKMLHQRQRALQKHRDVNISGNMVMATDSLPQSEVALSSSPQHNAAGVRPNASNFSWHGPASSSTSTPRSMDQSMLEHGRMSPLRAASPLNLMPPLDNMNMMSFGDSRDQDTSGLILPETMCLDDKEEEARRRSSLAQELDERGICPVYDPLPPGGNEAPMDISNISLPEMRSFLLQPLPKSVGMMECRIIRERSGMNRMFPKYILESDAGVFFMAAKKQKHNKTSNYAIVMSKCDEGKDCDSFLGKLRSNFLGLEFISYGAGLNPKKIDTTMSQVHAIQLARQELVAVQYSSSLWGSKPRGPRKMCAVIPRVQPSGDRLRCRTLHPEAEGLLALQKSGTAGRLIDCYQNKPPKWNDQIGAFVLNFNKRVTQASVKNFQLTHNEDPDTVYLQFGRVGKDVFNMDFRHPFSPFQAFAICLSSFDYKLCCE